jgi:hypothetical protein
MEGLSSSHAAADTITDSSSDAETFLRGTFFEDEGRRTNYRLLNIPLTSKHQVNEEASFDLSCSYRAHPSDPLTRIFSHIQLDFIH